MKVPIIAPRFAERRASGLLVPPALKYMSEMERYSEIFVQPRNSEIMVGRYFEKWKFEDFIEKNALYLASLSTQEDIEEGLLSQPARIHEAEFYLRYNNTKAVSQIPEMENDIRNHTFISCWTMDEMETMSKWEAYCPSGTGILVRTRYSKLRSLIPHPFQKYFIGLVKYGDRRSDMINYGNAFNQTMFKDRSRFQNENEVRVMKFDAECKQGFIYLPMQAIDLIDEMVMHPQASDEEYFCMIHTLSTIAPGVQKRLVRSRLPSKALKP